MSTLFLLPLLLSLPAQASNKVGNGGNVVECQAKKGAPGSVRLLDFYERDLQPTGEGDPVKIAEQALTSLEKASPALALQYRGRLREIRGEMEHKTGVKLTTVDDSHHLFRPKEKRCKVRQIAIRRRQVFGGEKRFLVNDDLWRKLSAADQAGLLLHEIVYEHFSKLGEEDSAKARQVNALLFSGSFDSQKFWALIQEMRLPIYP